MATWGISEFPQTGGIPAGTKQSSSRHAVERISAQGQERENPSHPQDSRVLFRIARGSICRDACELFAFMEGGPDNGGSENHDATLQDPTQPPRRESLERQGYLGVNAS